MPVIEVHRLGKRYRLGRDAHWAVRDVSFSIHEQEVVGIVGENGAGKSTLLRLLTGVTTPTTGTVRVEGRVGALLELGSGFHPDLTGRENVFLNGALLGSSRREIVRRFDEIVAFAGLEGFIDLPLRTYSSGMAARLGFAITVLLDPDVLVIDEVLAVGDQAFQLRCVQAIAEFIRRPGKILLFISHDANLVRLLCGRTLWLRHGALVQDGPAEEVIRRYSEAVQESQLAIPAASNRPVSRDNCGIERVELLDTAGRPVKAIASGAPLRTRITYHAGRSLADPVFAVSLFSSHGTYCSGLTTRMAGLTLERVEGRGVLELEYESVPFTDGVYLVAVGLFEADALTPIDVVFQAASFRVIGDPRFLGTVRLAHRWSVSNVAGLR